MRFIYLFYFFFSSRRRHTRSKRDWSSDVCSSDLRRVVSPAVSLTTKNHPILLFSRRALREAHARRLETISHPRFRPDVVRLRRVAFDLFAQLIDDHAQIFRFFSIFRPPNGLQQSSMGQRLALIGDEVLEDLEFLRGQVHFLAAHRQLPAFEIQREVL